MPGLQDGFHHHRIEPFPGIESRKPAWSGGKAIFAQKNAAAANRPAILLKFAGGGFFRMPGHFDERVGRWPWASDSRFSLREKPHAGERRRQRTSMTRERL